MVGSVCIVGESGGRCRNPPFVSRMTTILHPPQTPPPSAFSGLSALNWSAWPLALGPFPPAGPWSAGAF